MRVTLLLVESLPLAIYSLRERRCDKIEFKSDELLFCAMLKRFRDIDIKKMDNYKRFENNDGKRIIETMSQLLNNWKDWGYAPGLLIFAAQQP